MNRSLLCALALAAVPWFVARSGDVQTKAKAALPPATYEFFASEIKDKYPDQVKAYAIAEATVTKIGDALYCPGRSGWCGLNASCPHEKRRIATLDVKIDRMLFSTAEFAWPTEFNAYPNLGKNIFKEGEHFVFSLYGYATGSTGVSKVQRLEVNEPAPKKKQKS